SPPDATSTPAPTTLLQAAARTLLATPPNTSVRDTLEQTARDVRLARPGLVFFTAFGLFWGFVNVVVVAAALVRLIRGTDLSTCVVRCGLALRVPWRWSSVCGGSCCTAPPLTVSAQCSCSSSKAWSVATV